MTQMALRLISDTIKYRGGVECDPSLSSILKAVSEGKFKSSSRTESPPPDERLKSQASSRTASPPPDARLNELTAEIQELERTIQEMQATSGCANEVAIRVLQMRLNTLHRERDAEAETLHVAQKMVDPN